MENIQKIIEGIIEGLFFSSLYLGASFLASYLSIYWNLSNPAFAWITIGTITYTCLSENENESIVTTIGVISIIGMWLYHNIISEAIPLPLWVYIVVNSIVCFNIIITCIQRMN